MVSFGPNSRIIQVGMTCIKSSLLCLIAFKASAEVSDSGFRTSLQIEKAFESKTLVRFEQEDYWYNDSQNWYQSLFRLGIGYQLNPRTSVFVGYDYMPTHLIGRASYNQQNVWPMLRYIRPLGNGTFTFRSMWESNFVGISVRERARHLLRYMLPLDFEPHLSFIVADEVYYRVNSTDWGGKSGFDSNSLFAGFGWTFHSGLRTELGYYNQYSDDLNHRINTIRHSVQLSVVYNF